jgi:hypothetical protein
MIVCEGVETSRPFRLGSGWPGPAPSPGLFSYLGRCPPCRAPGAQPPGGGRSQPRSVACTRHRLPPCPERVQLSCERGTEAVSSWRARSGDRRGVAPRPAPPASAAGGAHRELAARAIICVEFDHRRAFSGRRARRGITYQRARPGECSPVRYKKCLTRVTAGNSVPARAEHGDPTRIDWRFRILQFADALAYVRAGSLKLLYGARRQDRVRVSSGLPVSRLRPAASPSAEASLTAPVPVSRDIRYRRRKWQPECRKAAPVRKDR